MSVMKEVLLKWTEAVEKFEMKNFEKARQKFEEFGDTAKLLYNSGICLMILEEREEAIIKFSKAIDKDSYFAAAYFQRGRLQFQKDDFEGALEDYQDCYEVRELVLVNQSTY